ncbi:MAG: 50S ribosomal protein L25 [Acidobacteria bacterium]|nr:50S ribosomal protein L25 [Acidobacteriota bacterium]
MRSNITVIGEARASRGKNEARRTRRRAMIPAVVYGAGKAPVPVAISPKELTQILHSKTGHNTIFDLHIGGQEQTPVMIVDRQVDPLNGRLLHADLKRIDLTKRIRVSVPVVTQGEARGIKLQGGLLETITREVEIECVPDEIPEHFAMDVSELMIGQGRRASDIPMIGSMKLVSAPESVIAHVVALKVEAQAATEAAPAEPVAAAGAAEPEVIKKGKKEEEGEQEAKQEGKGKKK